MNKVEAIEKRIDELKLELSKLFTNDPKVIPLRIEIKALLDELHPGDNAKAVVTTNGVVFTAEHLEAGKSINGAWSMKQLKLLGVNHKKKGWKRRAIGREYTQAVIEKFINLKDKHLVNGRNVIEIAKEKQKLKKALKVKPDPLDAEFLHVTAGI
jgi:hypothetical protein